MRPITLTISAFGPFPDRQLIDFRKMGETPLFLINGPTGSGKTTILDAICFALYGKTTGNEREGNQMRADLAAPDRLTEVSLVFELAGNYYRIRRLPEQQKPKSRGEGTTTQSPEAQLWQLDSPEATDPEQQQLLVSSKVTEANAMIESLTGLNADQFRQVMVLPQGKFRQLLMAESKQREAIFSQLFQTQIYQRLEERLKAEASGVRQQREKQHQLMAGILEGSGIESEDALQQEYASLQPNWQQQGNQRQQAADLVKEQQRLQQQGIQLDQAFAQLVDTEKQLQQLLQQQENINSQRQLMQRAAVAQRIAPGFNKLELLKERQKQLQSEQQALQQQHQQASQTQSQAAERYQHKGSYQQQLDSAKQHLSDLQAHQQRVKELEQYRQQVLDIEIKRNQSEQSVSEAERQLGELQQQRRDLEQHQQTLQESLLPMSEYQTHLAQLSESLKNAEDLQQKSLQQRQLESGLLEAERAGQRVKADFEVAERQLKQTELRWHQGQAAVLAGQLQQGEPCLVCGSCDHPAPHPEDIEVPDQQQLEQARQQLNLHRNQLSQAREEYKLKGQELRLLGQQIQQQCQLLQISSLEELDIPELQQQQQQSQQQLDQLLANQKQLQQTTLQIQQLQQQEQQFQASLQQHRDLYQQLDRDFVTVQSLLQRIEKELPEAFRAAGGLQSALNETQQNIVSLQRQLDQIEQTYQRANQQLAEINGSLQPVQQQIEQVSEQIINKESEWQKQLSESEFSDQEAFSNACLSSESMDRIQHLISDYDRKLNELQGALAQQQLSLKDQQPPDLQKLQQQLQQAEHSYQEVDQQWQQLDRRLNQLQEARNKLQQARERQQQIDEQYRLIGTLSDVANGQTGNKISLQRFVLSVLLDDVLVEASRRLQIMSKGRYQLWRKEERAKGNRASGLDLEVEDAYTGKVRPVATLSGGESFMAALSMALGLSEVVQAYSGGIRLDTLFIDEGFGSLDPESLDLAVQTLVDLRSSGRTVGVISHVSELKEQIDIRLDVLSDREGSRIRAVVPVTAPAAVPMS